MRAVLALAVVGVLIVVLLFAVWPPAWAPETWRRWTRPLRRRVRPRHYM